MGDARLFGEFNSPGFADNVHFDRPWILHGRLDLCGDVAGEFNGAEVVNRFGAYDDTNFSAGANGISFVDAREAGSDVFQLAHALDKVFGANVARTGAGSRQRIDDTDDQGLGRGGIDIVMMSFDGVSDRLWDAVFARHF